MTAGAKALKRFVADVERAGGSTKMTHDGHLAVYSRSGSFVVKMRTHGKQVGDDQGSTGRSVRRQVLRRVADE